VATKLWLKTQMAFTQTRSSSRFWLVAVDDAGRERTRPSPWIAMLSCAPPK